MIGYGKVTTREIDKPSKIRTPSVIIRKGNRETPEELSKEELSCFQHKHARDSSGACTPLLWQHPASPSLPQGPLLFLFFFPPTFVILFVVPLSSVLLSNVSISSLRVYPHKPKQRLGVEVMSHTRLLYPSKHLSLSLKVSLPVSIVVLLLSTVVLLLCSESNLKVVFRATFSVVINLPKFWPLFDPEPAAVQGIATKIKVFTILIMVDGRIRLLVAERGI
mmetsp:Transcript_42380/g.83258  ORF Transcript_42380/g.83258 Transcript_42380/m.83258 type:complete len:221 (-) Transcript_42380:93-755(-)